MSVKEHYDRHLARFYSWMVGDFEKRSQDFKSFLTTRAILPEQSGIAIDLGAGHGIHTRALAQTGFKVLAVDFNETLLAELKQNTQGLDVEAVNDDIRHVAGFSSSLPELVVCMGDTLTHLATAEEVRNLIHAIGNSLATGGKIIFSFRDYSKGQEGEKRSIEVKSDDNYRLTCVLEYKKDHIVVTDIFQEKINNRWRESQSSYHKVRLDPSDVEVWMKQAGINVTVREEQSGMLILLGRKL